MSNSYFNFTTGRMVAGENALAEDVNSGFDAVAAGFDKLPTPDATKFLAGAHETTSGSAGNFVLAVTADSYFDGMAVSFKTNHSNSGACTLNVGSLGAKSLVDGNGAALAVGDIVANNIYAARYNSTSDKFHLVGLSSGNVADAAVVAANIADVATIADNIDELLLVDDNAIAAAGSASEASGYAEDALTQAGHASGYADAASASAANLPNATTAGADKILTTNSTGDGWSYISKYALNGKNLLINGGFDVWQRGTSFAGGTNQYTADRWFLRRLVDHGNIMVTKTVADSLSGVVPAAPNFFLTLSVGAFEDASIAQRIEYLPQFSDKTLTCSFWICRLNGDGELDVQLNAHFGTGGTPTAYTRPLTGTSSGTAFPSGTWFEQRTVTMDVPDLSGYSLGTDANTSYLEVEISFLNAMGYGSTCMISGVQLEFGDTATDFEYRHPAEELALCQRYYETGTERVVATQYQVNRVAVGTVTYQAPKRVAVNPSIDSATFYGHDGTPGPLLSYSGTTRGFAPTYEWSEATTGRSCFAVYSWSADAEL